MWNLRYGLLRERTASVLFLHKMVVSGNFRFKQRSINIRYICLDDILVFRLSLDVAEAIISKRESSEKCTAD